jgi:hypothetical protein
MSDNHLLTEDFYSLTSKYPIEIKTHLCELFSLAIDCFDLNNLISILFIGSGARCEMSFKVYQDKLDIFSDYEFVLIVKRQPLSYEVKIFNEKIEKLEEKWNIRSPLFHVDYGISKLFKFKLTPPTLWAYEAKEFGIVVYGENVKKYLPEVTIDNLDYGNLNELIIVRLWNMLLHVNNGFIKGTNNEYENFIIKFYYSRNVLDILTILLPNYGILKGGYSSRLNYFVNKFDNRKWKKYESDFKQITDFKIKLHDKVELEEVQEIFYKGFLELALDISNIGAIDSLESLENYDNNKLIKKIFKEKLIRSLRRKYIDLKMVNYYYKFSNKSLLFIFFNNTKVTLLLTLFYIHKSIKLPLATHISIENLKHAMFLFNKISSSDVYVYDDKKEFSDNFINFRYRLVDFMLYWKYSRSGTSKKDLINNIEWRENE